MLNFWFALLHYQGSLGLCCLRVVRSEHSVLLLDSEKKRYYLSIENMIAVFLYYR